MKKAHKKAVFLRNKDARGVFLRSLDSIASDSAFVLDIRKMAFRNFPDISRFTNITAIYAENNQFADI